MLSNTTRMSLYVFCWVSIFPKWGRSSLVSFSKVFYFIFDVLICLAPLIFRESGGSFLWVFNRPSVRTFLYAFMWLEILVLLFPMELTADRSFWGWIYLGLTKLQLYLYFSEAFIKSCDAVEWLFIVVWVGVWFCCVIYRKGFWFFLFVDFIIFFHVLVIVYWRFGVIPIIIGRIVLLLGVWFLVKGFRGRFFCWSWGLFV